jgi:hypothetical protein
LRQAWGRSALRDLVRNREVYRQLVKTRFRLEYNIKVAVKGMGWEEVN